MARGHYRSPLREAGADRTRAEILEAGRALFAQHGYETATVAAIAAAAGVATPTVYSSVGGKRELLLALCREAVASPLRDEGLAGLAAAADAREAIGALAGGARELNERYGPVLWIAAGARSVPEAAELWQRGLQLTREVCARAATRPGELHALREGVGVDEAATTLSALVHPALLRTLVGELGLGWDDAERWLRTSCERLLLDDRP